MEKKKYIGLLWRDLQTENENEGFKLNICTLQRILFNAMFNIMILWINTLYITYIYNEL